MTDRELASWQKNRSDLAQPLQLWRTLHATPPQSRRPNNELYFKRASLGSWLSRANYETPTYRSAASAGNLSGQPVIHYCSIEAMKWGWKISGIPFTE
jgi:hypothetical protein